MACVRCVVSLICCLPLERPRLRSQLSSLASVKNNADGKTSCYRGRCVECTSSSDCTDVLSPVCDTVSKTCVQCTSTRDCASGVCSSNNVCVECTSNSRCSGRGTYIDFICSTYAGNAREQLLMNTCAECVVNSDCPYRMICAGNTCSCTSDAQCDSPQPYCYEGRCQSCPGSTTIGHGVCSSTIVGGTCQLRESTSEVYRCVECETASDCGGAACVDGSCSCMSHGCADGLYCDKVTEKCVECLQDAQCMDPEAPYCGPLGQCVQCTGVDVTCRKEITLGMVTCNQAYGTCEPMCDSDVRSFSRASAFVPHPHICCALNSFGRLIVSWMRGRTVIQRACAAHPAAMTETALNWLRIVWLGRWRRTE